MPIGLATAAILMLFASFWCLNVARDPRVWRLWWMDLLGVLDVDTDREMRRRQEQHMSTICYLLFILLLAASLSSAFWTVDLVRENRREKTSFERELNLNRDEIDKVQSQPQGLKR